MVNQTLQAVSRWNITPIKLLEVLTRLMTPAGEGDVTALDAFLAAAVTSSSPSIPASAAAAAAAAKPAILMELVFVWISGIVLMQHNTIDRMMTKTEKPERAWKD